MSETNKNPNQISTRAKVAGVAAGIAAVGALFHGFNHDSEKPEPTGVYEVQKGDTFSGIAEKVAENTPQHETMQEAAENIRDINELGRYPDIAASQELEVPASADVDRFQPGVQLDKRTMSGNQDMKYANHGEEVPAPATNAPVTSESPQPVVPEENGFNPDTPR